MPPQSSSRTPSSRKNNTRQRRQQRAEHPSQPTPQTQSTSSPANPVDTMPAQPTPLPPQQSKGKGKATPRNPRPSVHTVAMVAPASTTPSDTFDPKSIVPARKADKSIERLREALASTHRESSSHFVEYQCIDGAPRLFGALLPPTPQPPPPAQHPSPPKPEDTSCPSSTPLPRFVAYGIDAYPTLVRKNEICRKFASPTAFCEYGHRCHRIHPRDRAAFRSGTNKSNQRSTTPHTSHDITQPTSPRAPTQTTSAPSPSSSSRSSASASPSSSPAILLARLVDSDTTQSDASMTSDEGFQLPTKHASPKALTHPLPARPITLPTLLPPRPRSPPLSQAQPIRPRPDRPAPREYKYHPRTINVCINSTHGACTLGYHCRFVHKDLEYEPRPPMRITRTMRNHLQVEFGPGFTVTGLSTSCESPWISISNLSDQTPVRDIQLLLQPFGKIDDLQYPIPRSTPMTVRVKFAKAAEGAKALAALHGTTFLGRIISIRYIAQERASFVKENRIRLEWQVPTADCYCGYNTLAEAEAAVAKSKTTPYGDYAVKGVLHEGIPRVGSFTVKFTGLPNDATEEGAQIWGPTTHVVWTRVHGQLTPTSSGVGMLKKTLRWESKDFKDLVFNETPYHDGVIRAWAVFSDDCDDAKRLAEEWRNWKPRWNDRKRVYVRHIKTVVIKVEPTRFFRVEGLIPDFARSVRSHGETYSFTFNRSAQKGIVVLIAGLEMKALIRLKLDFEDLLNGQVVQVDKEIVWHPFFNKPEGFDFFRELRIYCPGITIHSDGRRRMIRLYGAKPARNVVWRRIVDQFRKLVSYMSRTIRVDGVVFSALASGGFASLESRVGEGNVTLDFRSQALRVRDDPKIYNAVLEMVEEMRSQHNVSRPRVEGEYLCPVCFESCTLPIWLDCNHAWCKSCLTSYLRANISLNQFPLKCLGDEATCSECIPLDVASILLTPTEYESLTAAALNAYIKQNPKKFRPCPTPDCEQVYRVLPPDVAPVKCPSCLVRICAHCNTETHDGLSCDEVSNGEGLFQEWVGKNNVRQCPGCEMAIEKAEGCNHMKCTICETHICWFCMATFPKDGDGVYAHMHAVHGGYGLPDGIPDDIDLFL